MSGLVARRSALTGSAAAALGLAAGVTTARASPALSVNDRRLDALVTAAIRRIADTPAPDLDGLRVKARLLIDSPPVREDEERSSAIGASLGLDVLRLLGPGGRHHGS